MDFELKKKISAIFLIGLMVMVSFGNQKKSTEYIKEKIEKMIDSKKV